jgi:hypothetical protein
MGMLLSTGLIIVSMKKKIGRSEGSLKVKLGISQIAMDKVTKIKGQTTYHALIIKLAKSENILATWQNMFKTPYSQRIMVANKIKDYIKSNWKLHIGKQIFYIPKGRQELTKEEAIKLYTFLFYPIEVKYTWAYE